MYDDNLEEEEEEEQKEIKPKRKRVVLNLDPNVLFNEEGKFFSFRKDFPQKEPLPQVKDWKKIAFDFLNSSDYFPEIGPQDSFQDLDTTRASEFVAGQGAPNWSEIRKKALENSKEKRRRAKK